MVSAIHLHIKADSLNASGKAGAWPAGDGAGGGGIRGGVAEKVGTRWAQGGGLGAWETLGQWGWQEGAGQGKPTVEAGCAGPHAGWPQRAVAFLSIDCALVRLTREPCGHSWGQG